MTANTAGASVLLLWACFGLAACSNHAPSSPPVAPPSTPLASPEPPPQRLQIAGDPNGLWWDAPSQTLYLADDDANRILTWNEAKGFGLFRQLPGDSPQTEGLGQVVLTPDGTVVVTRFGRGGAGDIALVPPSGEPTVIPNLDPERRRIGLTVTADGRLFDVWFKKPENGVRVGSVGSVSLAGTETEIVTGLKKPVGVLAVGDKLYVSDQEMGAILVAPIATPAPMTVFSHLAEPDLLAAGPNGSLLTGGAGGVLYRVNANGTAVVIRTGFHQIRGVAYDATHHRAFVADHSGGDREGDASASAEHFVYLVPLE